MRAPPDRNHCSLTLSITHFICTVEQVEGIYFLRFDSKSTATATIPLRLDLGVAIVGDALGKLVWGYTPIAGEARLID